MNWFLERLANFASIISNLYTRSLNKSRLKLGNACYHSVQKLLSSSLIYKNLKIKIYRTIILPVVLYGCETWSLTLREERRLRVFENRVLRGIFWSKRKEVTRKWRKLHNEEPVYLFSYGFLTRKCKPTYFRPTSRSIDDMFTFKNLVKQGNFIVNRYK